MRGCLLIYAFILTFSFAYSQSPKSPASDRFHFAPLANVVLSEIKTDWDPQLQSLEMPAPGSQSYRRYLIDLKEELYGHYEGTGVPLKITDTALLNNPEILAGWEGNPMGTGVPNDNDVAISNDGKIISVINSSIYVFDTTDSLLYSVSLGAFSDTLGLPDSKFDPKVAYDPLADKFVMVFLNATTVEHSQIVIAFSQTSDPLGAWNLYALPGNPKNNDTWSDFPMIAITETELFITVNLIIPDEPWQTAFVETVIWQLQLDDGYNGDTLNTVFRDSIYFEGFPIRNLNPVKGGATSHGPDMFFLSNRNFAVSNDTIFIVHITGELDDPGTEVEINYSLSDVNYGVPPQARQFPPYIFDTNDGRILGSFYEDNQIQFVSNSLDPATGFCGIFHGIISDPGGAATIQAQIIGDDTLDLGYPNISYTGKFDGDNQSIITFDHTAPTVYAGMSAIFYNWGAYSDIVNIKTGDTYVNVLSGAYERWGDYSGSQRKYNEPGVVWVSGNFGKYIDVFPFASRNNATWIASLKSTVQPAVAVGEENDVQLLHIYPNPASQYFHADLELESGGTLQFRLYDADGKLIKYLLQANAASGNNIFSFSLENLLPGSYFLEIRLNNQPWQTRQVIKL